MKDPTQYATAAAVVGRLGMDLRARRELFGMSLRGVAKASGVSFNTVKRVEDGKGFDSHSLLALLRWLDDPEPPEHCMRPPMGWWCSRAEGHDGPCAARPVV